MVFLITHTYQSRPEALKGGKMNKYPNNYSISSKTLGYIGSVIVIVSFFMPWIGSDLSAMGFKIVKLAAGSFKLAKYSQQWILIGTAGLLFALSPIVCHVLNIFIISTRREISKTVNVIPIAIWATIFLFISIKLEKPSIPEAEMLSIGFIGTLIGMSIGLIGAFSKAPIVGQSTYKYCTKCGETIESDSLFCPECGTTVEEDTG